MERKGQIQEPEWTRLRTSRIQGGRQGSVLAFSHTDQSTLVQERATAGKQYFPTGAVFLFSQRKLLIRLRLKTKQLLIYTTRHQHQHVHICVLSAADSGLALSQGPFVQQWLLQESLMS